MRLTRPSHLLAAALLAGVLTWAVSAVLDPAGDALRLTWAVPAVLLAAAVVVVVAGWPVRRLTRAVRREQGDRAPGSAAGRFERAPVAAGVHLSDVHRVDPRRATQVLALARAAAFAGAGLAGAYVALALATLPTEGIAPRTERLTVAAVAALSCVALSVVGVVVERWCRLPTGRGGPP